ncbi:MAG: type II secretion system F family protein, partial [Nocardioidaceae bacterium]
LTAINNLSLSLQTHLYDGVRQAISTTGKAGARSILLLSDGKDTTGTSLDPVLKAAKSSGVRIDAVSLNQTLTASSPLSQIVKASNGAISSTSNAKDLQAMFASEANDLNKQLLVSFDLPKGFTATEGTVQISVKANGTTYTGSAFVGLSPVGDSTGHQATGPVYIPAPVGGFHISTPWLIGGVGLLFLGLAGVLVFGMTRMMPAEKTPTQKQLELYTLQGPKKGKVSKVKDSGTGMREQVFAAAERLVEKRDFEAVLTEKLDRAGLHFKASEWLLLHVGLAIGAGVVGMLLKGPLLMIIFLAFGLVGPWVYLSFKESRRIKGFNQGLAQTLQVISGALSAGLSLPQAVDTVVQEGTEPIASEFRRAIVEQRLGVEIEDALDGVADRMKSTDFKWVVMAIRIQREVGGNLSELLLTVAATLREREYLRRQVSVLSAEGRLSAWILGGLPILFTIYLTLARPTYIAPMYHNKMGWLMLGAAVVMMILGAFGLKKAIKVEV